MGEPRSTPTGFAWWRRLRTRQGTKKPIEAMAGWRVRLFRFMQAREQREWDYYGIPRDRVTRVDTDTG